MGEGIDSKKQESSYLAIIAKASLYDSDQNLQPQLPLSLELRIHTHICHTAFSSTWWIVIINSISPELTSLYSVSQTGPLSFSNRIHTDLFSCGDSDATTALLCPWVPHQIYLQILLFISAMFTQGSSLPTSPMAPAVPLLPTPSAVTCQGLYNRLCPTSLSPLTSSGVIVFTSARRWLLPQKWDHFWILNLPTPPLPLFIHASHCLLCHSVCCRHALFLLVSWSGLAGIYAWLCLVPNHSPKLANASPLTPGKFWWNNTFSVW